MIVKNEKSRGGIPAGLIETLERRLLFTATAFQIDPAQSRLSLSVSLQNGAAVFAEQAPGSLTTIYQGTIDADVSGSSISLTGGNANAATNGNWQPGGTAADYGGQVSVLGQTAFAAIRNLRFGLASGPIPFATEGAFDASGIQVTATAGTIQADLGSFGSLNESFAGAAAADAPPTFALLQPDSTGGEILTIPIHLTFPFTVNQPNDATLTFDGTLTATTGGAVATGPRLTVLQGSNSIAPGQSQPATFSSAELGGSGPVDTFTVRNDGTGILTLGTLGVPAGFSLVKPPPTTLSPGAADTFQIALSTAEIGTITGILTIPTNDSQSNPFTFSLAGTVTPAVSGGLVVGQVTSQFPASIHSGRKPVRGRVTLLLINNGNARVRGNTTLTLFAAPGPSPSPDNGTLLRRTAVKVSLAPGAQKAVSVKVNLPSLAVGSYFIVASIPTTGAGSSENNSSTATPIEVI